MSLFKELRRRSVFKVGIAYVVIAWLVAQVLQLVFESFGTPDWVMKTVLTLLATGWPLALFFAWAFEVTPDGIKKTDFNEESPAVANQPETVTEAVAEPTAPVGASVAVLPFVNMSGDAENEYFSDGLSEELLNVLSKINELKVAARTSSFHFKGETGNIAEIARSLGVASVLEGSVRQSGARVRITAQLINAADGYHMWSETFDRDLTDIFAVQDEIASSVAAALKVKLLGGDTASLNTGGTQNPEAFKEYLQGVHFRNRGSDQSSLKSAVDAFENAIKLDPGYAQAYAGLAFAWDQLATNGFIKVEDGLNKVVETTSRAIELAPDLADGYLVLGRMLLHYRLDQEGAQNAINTALKLNPGNSDVQIEFARISCYFRDVEASVTAAQKALELDPVSMFAHHFLGHVLYFGRRYNEAIAVFRHALILDPQYPRNRYTMGMCIFLQGDKENALKEIEGEPLSWMKNSGSAILLHRLGRLAEAESFLDFLKSKQIEENALYQQGQIYTQWGDADQAIKYLNYARDYNDPGLSQLMVDPLLDPIRDDPRFNELIAKIGFVPVEKT